MTNVVYELDLSNLPPLTEAQEAQLDALEHRKIDYSDIPQLDADFVRRAVRNPLYNVCGVIVASFKENFATVKDALVKRIQSTLRRVNAYYQFSIGAECCETTVDP